MTTEELIALSDRYIMSTYKRFPIVLTRGLGVHVWDSDGKPYLDLVGGIAVCALGHAHPRVVEAVKRQAEILSHVSNLYHIENQILLARLLVENSCLDKVFFCNSGAEANEAAIKLARKYASEKMEGKYELITMQDSFHGRTLATVTATGQDRFHAGFAPLPEGFRYVPYNDLAALEAAVTDRTCGVMVEPIQGEGGVVIPAPGYLQGIRKICDERGLLMIVDEVQTGIGRTGTLFACEQEEVVPDMITLAKALGNGFPIGALLAAKEVAAAFVPGSHGSTFGGNPLATAAGIAVLETILDEEILDNCSQVGEYFVSRLAELKEKNDRIREVRGRGLILAVELTVPGADFVLEMHEERTSDQLHRRKRPAFCPSPYPHENRRGQGRGHPLRGPGGVMKKDLLSEYDLEREDYECIFEKAHRLKRLLREGREHATLKGKTLGMIFDKSSTRTRISFEVGMYQMGGIALFLSNRDTQLGRGEIIADSARIMSRYLDGIMIRTFSQDAVEEFARYATIPVINGLTDLLHPCQLLSDLFTIIEKRGGYEGLKIAYVGDGNNMANSWINAAAKLPFHLDLACPEGYDPDPAILKRGMAEAPAGVSLHRDPTAAVCDADIVYTDVWVSMGQEGETRGEDETVSGLSGQSDPARPGEEGRPCHALPPRPQGGRDHGGGDRRPAVRRYRRGGEPSACPEGRYGNFAVRRKRQ